LHKSQPGDGSTVPDAIRLIAISVFIHILVKSGEYHSLSQYNDHALGVHAGIFVRET
jgi:hypothetical protein